MSGPNTCVNPFVMASAASAIRIEGLYGWFDHVFKMENSSVKSSDVSLVATPNPNG